MRIPFYKIKAIIDKYQRLTRAEGCGVMTKPEIVAQAAATWNEM
jgi:hypothetical protein